MTNGNPSSSPQERLDAATAQRLAKLADAPVDVSALMVAVEQRLEQLPRAVATTPRVRFNPWHWFTPLRAMAAGISLIALSLALVLYVTSRPAQASLQTLVNFHENMVCEHCLPADSVASANAALAKQSPGAPLLPEMASDHLNCCCVHCQDGVCLSCACCQADGQRVTLVVGNQRQIRPPPAASQKIGGQLCHVASTQGINLCTMEHGDRWVCVIGSVPVERLAELAGAVRW
jgi:hypothetical protein